MYESERKKERPGKGCIIGLIIVVAIVVGIGLFVRFGVPRIIGKMLASDNPPSFIPAEATELLSENREEVEKVMKEYNIDLKTMNKMVNSIDAKKTIQYADDVLSGKLANADQAIDEFVSQIDFGDADIERIKRELKANADYKGIQEAARQIKEQEKTIKALLPAIKDVIKSFLKEAARTEEN